MTAITRNGKPCPRCKRIKDGHYASAKELKRRHVSLDLCALCQFDEYAAGGYNAR